MGAVAVNANDTAAIEQDRQLESSMDDPGEEVYSRRRFYSSAGIGIDFSRGDYGEPDETDVYSVPAFLKLEYEPIALRVLVPFVMIDGSDGVVVGEGGQGSADGTDRRVGIGDVIARFTYTWFPEREYVPIIDVSTKLKIPTASKADGIGTGEVDVTFQLEMTETIGLVSVFGGGGYRIKGGFYRDIWLASVGTSVRLARRVSVGVAYDFRQGSTSTAGDSHEVVPFASIRLNPHFRFGPYIIAGLSENSPDWGTGATFTVDF
jgi:hypothetical protein